MLCPWYPWFLWWPWFPLMALLTLTIHNFLMSMTDMMTEKSVVSSVADMIHSWWLKFLFCLFFLTQASPGTDTRGSCLTSDCNTTWEYKVDQTLLNPASFLAPLTVLLILAQRSWTQPGVLFYHWRTLLNRRNDGRLARHGQGNFSYVVE